MTRRAPAARGKADSNQGSIADAISLLGYPVMDLSHAGNGVEDLLVPISIDGVSGDFVFRHNIWLLVECKVASPSGKVRYTQAQIEWRRLTEGWPRITVVSAQDAVDQLRELTR